MIVLYDGEYKDFDIATNPNWEQMLKIQSESYPQWVGKVYGDFEIVKIEYDWYLSIQRGTVRCIHCGAEKYIKNPADFRRGKGASQRCVCQKPKKENKAPPEDKSETYRTMVGQTAGDFDLLDYIPSKGFRMRCRECGCEVHRSGAEVVRGETTCRHITPNKYGDDLIGQKFGNLTVVERRGRYFNCRCDCGFEKVIRPTDFVRGAVTTCGRPRCEFHIKRNGSSDAIKSRASGFDFEHHLQDVFENAGYEVERTPETGDYGVDFIVTINDERWAFQCKKMKAPANTHAVLEVYAGGRYHDCTRFCVASPSGFSYNARKCAAKLGVQLETEKFRFNMKKEDYVAEMLETTQQNLRSGSAVLWEIDGVIRPAQEWCEEYGVSKDTVMKRVKDGMSLKDALRKPRYGGRTTIDIGGIIKTKQEWCEEYGISTQLYDYRTKQGGLSPLEALTKPKAREAAV